MAFFFVTSRIHQSKRKTMNTYVFVSSYIIITVFYFLVCRAFIQIRKMCMESNAYTCVFKTSILVIVSKVKKSRNRKQIIDWNVTQHNSFQNLCWTKKYPPPSPILLQTRIFHWINIKLRISISTRPPYLYYPFLMNIWLVC